MGEYDIRHTTGIFFSVFLYHFQSFFSIDRKTFMEFLVACTRLYMSLCRSVGWLVGWSVGWLVGRSVMHLFFWLRLWSLAFALRSGALQREREEEEEKEEETKKQQREENLDLRERSQKAIDSRWLRRKVRIYKDRRKNRKKERR